MTFVDIESTVLYFKHTHTNTHTAFSHTSDGNHDNLAASASSSPTLSPSISFALSYPAFILCFVHGRAAFPGLCGGETRIPETSPLFFPSLFICLLFLPDSNIFWLRLARSLPLSHTVQTLFVLRKVLMVMV